MGKIEGREFIMQDEFRWYRRHGGKLSESTYRSALQVVQGTRFADSTKSQAIHMLKNMPRTETGRARRYIQTSATSRTYCVLREPMAGECAGWSDQAIFAEVLLMLHYVAGSAAFERKYPNIFNGK